MPFNSFDSYPMSFKPSRDTLVKPYYLCLANMIEREITSGKLERGVQLPPQRELADWLDLNTSTITKAYRLCEERGLVSAVVGKGTFVSSGAAVLSTVEGVREQGEAIDMGSVRPFYQHSEVVKEAAFRVLQREDAASLFESSSPFGSLDARQAGVRWMQQFGVSVPANQIYIAPGVQAALAAVLVSLFPKGSRIAVDSYTYPNFIGLANLLGIELVPIASDSFGMRSDLLGSACSRFKIAGLYCVPSGNNPTNIAMSMERRLEIGAIVKEKELIAIEDDNCAAVSSRKLRSLQAFCADQCIYISGLSKAICSGLRVAYLAVPRQYFDRVGEGLLHLNRKASALNAEIAALIIESKECASILEGKRREAQRRNGLFKTKFPDAPVSNESMFQWLPLPSDIAGAQAERVLLEKGVRVLGAERFAVGGTQDCRFIRVATSTPKTTGELIAGLDVVARLLSSL